MIKIGLTGSIGMGKSTVAAMFEALGAPVWSADAAVHRLYEKGGAASGPIAAAFPGAVKDGAVDRDRLGEKVLGDAEALRRLEAIVHPLAAQDRRKFIEDAAKAGAEAAVFDIPLLFETGGEKTFDAVVVVSAPEDVQRARVLARPGMTEEKLAAILAEQTPDAEKRKRADFVVRTGGPLEDTRAEVADVYKAILGSKGLGIRD
jgi:dephospho-CoA kinase